MAPLASPAAFDRRVDPMLPVARRVVRTRRELADVWTIEIEPEGDSFAFLPGQFNMLYAFGVGEAAISISGDPAESGRLVHTIRAVGKVSEALARTRPGDVIGVRGPFGVGWPVEAADGADVVVVAGGLGLAPLRPALYRLFGERHRFGRVVLLCGARSPKDILFRSEIEHWRARLDIEAAVTVDHADREWRGNVGVVTTLIGRAAFDPSNTVAFVCGPEVMMRFAAIELESRGVRPEAIHLSMERNMKCAIGHCGHCQFGGDFVCKDGPVATFEQLRRRLALREI
ncbi:MAG: FAD/NAD(P)-binding protein [Bauldia sp.]|nr:FAD/NAD(P)-binding protein [Bauldia sp.]